MKTYDKDALILEYLTMIQKQDKELIALRANKKTLENRVNNLKVNVKTYKAAALRWKEAFEDLTDEFNEYNKRLEDLMRQPDEVMAKCIKAYKENM